MLKKTITAFSIVFIICFTLFFCCFLQIKQMDCLNEVYVGNNSSNAKIYNQNSFNVKNALAVRGYSFKLEGNKNPQEILSKLNAKIVMVETTQYGQSIYAYSKDIKFRKNINGKIVNVQIFNCEQTTVIGFPIIYGSY